MSEKNSLRLDFGGIRKFRFKQSTLIQNFIFFTFQYSKHPKSGRPDFGVFKNCPVPKHYLKSGHKRPVIGRLVPMPNMYGEPDNFNPNVQFSDR